MSIDTAFLSLMPSTVTVYPHTTRDAYGKQSHSASGTSVRCRIQMDTSVNRGNDAREVGKTGTIYAYGVVSVATEDKVMLPDGLSALITSVTIANDENGPHHTVIRFTA